MIKVLFRQTSNEQLLANIILVSLKTTKNPTIFIAILCRIFANKLTESYKFFSYLKNQKK